MDELTAIFLFFDWAGTLLSGADPPVTAQKIVFPHVRLDPGYSTELNIINPGAAPADLQVQLIRPGSISLTQTIDLPARGAARLDVATFFNLSESWSPAYVTVTSNSEIAGFELVKSRGGDLEGMNARSADELLTHLYFPQMVVLGPWNTRLGVLNNSTESITLTISAFRPDGQPFGRETLVKNPVIRTLDPGEILIEGVASLFEFRGDQVIEGWLQVTANTPSISGFVVYGLPDAGVASMSPAREGHTRAIIPHIATGDGFFTGLAVLNAGDRANQVRILAMDPSGQVLGSFDDVLRPGQRISESLSEIIPEATEQNKGFIHVRSDFPVLLSAFFGSSQVLSHIPAQDVDTNQIDFAVGSDIIGSNTTAPDSNSSIAAGAADDPHSPSATAAATLGNASISASTTEGDIPFTSVVIDPNNPRNPHCKAVGDINGDGFVDVLAASAFGDGLFWYAYPSWSKHQIATGSFSTDMQTGDVDNDGDLDVIVPQGENRAHDLEVGDMNGDGKLDIVARGDGATTLFLQDSPSSWTARIIHPAFGEGIALGDIDRDGDLDVAQDGYWLEAPADKLNGTWVERQFATGWPTLVGVHIADVNADGRVDILLAPSESSDGKLAWYEAPADPRTGTWVEHVIDSPVSYLHTFKTADMDKDGHLDVVTAEMHQSNTDEVSVYRNNGGGLSWTQQVVATTGSHNLRLADIGGDGDMDIIGAN